MLNIIRVKNYEEMSRKAAAVIASQIILKPYSVLGLATGSTPVGTYERLVEMYRNGDLDFSSVSTVNLDEYRGLTGDNDQSYYYFMNRHLFNNVNIDKSRTNIPSGTNPDTRAECARYEALIEKLGGIDLQLLGLGRNGHIGFNEPAESFAKTTHCVNLTESTIEANARFFERKEDVPTQALTMGIGTIMKASKILVLVSGEDKADAVAGAFSGEVTPKLPASILQFHADVTLIGDDAALSKLAL